MRINKPNTRMLLPVESAVLRKRLRLGLLVQTVLWERTEPMEMRAEMVRMELREATARRRPKRRMVLTAPIDRRRLQEIRGRQAVLVPKVLQDKREGPARRVRGVRMERF